MACIKDHNRHMVKTRYKQKNMSLLRNQIIHTSGMAMVVRYLLVEDDAEL